MGTGAGRVTLTNGAGQFVVELPPGMSRFHWSKEGYVAHEAEYTVAAGSKTEVQIALRKTPGSSPFPPPPYTFTGLVTDSRGNPVIGAEVWIYSNSSPIDDRRGAGFTDPSGRYTIVGERIASAVRAQKVGYLATDAPINPPTSGTTWVTDLRIKRYERYTLIGPGLNQGWRGCAPAGRRRSRRCLSADGLLLLNHVLEQSVRSLRRSRRVHGPHPRHGRGNGDGHRHVLRSLLVGTDSRRPVTAAPRGRRAAFDRHAVRRACSLRHRLSAQIDELRRVA